MNNTPKPQSCTPVWAETGDWCFQACLQSFLADNGVQRGQREMVELGNREGCCDAKGVIPYDQGKNPDYQNVIDLCTLFNVELEKISDRRIPEKLKKHEGVLITPWNFKGTGSHHCVRFCGHVSEKKFVVMDPSPVDGEQFPVWEEAYIQDWCCDVFRIRLKDLSGSTVQPSNG